MGATLQPDFNAQTFYLDPNGTPAAQAAGQAEFYASFGMFDVCHVRLEKN